MSLCTTVVNVQRKEGLDAVYTILTLDIQERASGKWWAPCSTRCRATWPWSASSYNLRSYTGGSSHALNIKEKRKNEESRTSTHDKPHPNNTHWNTYPPWRISYLVQTYSTWPRRWSCPRSVPGETCKRQSAALNPAPVMVLYYLTR